MVIVTRIIIYNFSIVLPELSRCLYVVLQALLHSITCDNRALAAIGTHDFDKMGDNKTFIYTTRDPNELMFRPVGSDVDISATDYFEQQRLKFDNPKEINKVPHAFLQ